jgi:hypothetical protein
MLPPHLLRAVSGFLSPQEEAWACEVCRNWLFMFDVDDRWRVLFEEYFWSGREVRCCRCRCR